MNSALDVYWEKDLVGQLSLGSNQVFIFKYTEAWLQSERPQSISMSLPLQEKEFTGNKVRAFFANLLPESRVRELIARRLGISFRNDFHLLEALGGECAGALTFLPQGARPDHQGSYEPLPRSELDAIIHEMTNRPLLFAKEGIRLSLAGAQDKLPVYIEEKKFFLPRGSKASSHIIKPAIVQSESNVSIDNSVENEIFCLRLAHELGLPVPQVDMVSETSSFLIVKRYDRIRNVQGRLIRLHQEDFCQALGIGYDQKYESEGGPSFRDCFSLLARESTEPLLDMRFLLQWVVFNYLIGNCDAHAKNISLLYKRGSLRLAPFYDLLSTIVYPGLAQKFAMKIGRENRPGWVTKKNWESFAEDANVAPRIIFQTMHEMIGNLPKAILAAKKSIKKPHANQETLEKIEKYISDQCNGLKFILGA